VYAGESKKREKKSVLKVLRSLGDNKQTVNMSEGSFCLALNPILADKNILFRGSTKGVKRMIQVGAGDIYWRYENRLDSASKTKLTENEKRK